MKNEKNVNFIIEDVKLINDQLKKVELDYNLKKFIDKNIYFIKKQLSDFLIVKKHGSYAIDSIYNFDKKINVDLLAIKYVSKKMYKIYESEISTKEHFADCWICEINQLIFKKLVKKYEISDNVKVEWKTKKYKLLNNKELFIFNDSIEISFYKNNLIGFSIIIRTVLLHKDYPLIICSKNKYKRSFSLEFVKTFRILNKLLMKKMQILFYIIKLKNINKKQRLIFKINIMSDIQYQLLKNEYFRVWLDKSFAFNFSSKKDVDNLLESKLIYYKKNKKISKFYNSFKLVNLIWVFNKTHTDTKKFLDFYLDFCKKIWSNKPNKIYYWYDTVAYLKNMQGTTNISIKKSSKKYDNLEMEIISRPIYPLNKENGIFLVFLQYYNFEIN
ncbi:hypothetical protein [Spiroplasma taiwanense]|uniref:Uncharacterized protein n=1 Tax=Spiroplasma taiwanense CT-1 TaxID=1276220 RepID=S5LZ99_9MOLU|nr:hypothetical protein [Spiroplasma taiwanense]AGR41032.1 hypothetical protein STAIW_v1c03820 [Spiroplasma taiwanense CT-1]